MKHVGIIGVGHLGSAVLKGLLTSGYLKAEHISISGGTSGKAQTLAKQLNCHFCASNSELAARSGIVILAVIPRILPEILEEIKPHLKAGTLVISLAASFTLAQFYQYLPANTPIVRAIPNIPSAVCQGMTAISAAPVVSANQLTDAKQLFEAIGKIAIVDEKKLDISSTVAGCSPAYVAVFIEALADAGVLAGLSREEAYLLTTQAVMGTASLLLADNMLPAQLKDQVCSPGGTTIRGVAQLEKWGMRNAVIEAVKASAKIND
ncbi:pyrroline-5-carboxylate reductase [Orbus hercynius]|uniref:Pyrroline-5-carboxylate reductase n=1 Tax=Orbus hercynius TaxID=593135 RepID=A0A495RBD7_9GAMM|nr:pyrroline-5-carboxylate reductase [Orbus hercynius]RKS84792.1 pyrroline-5-carboxylate reductase [Orbus hercynius]